MTATNSRAGKTEKPRLGKDHFVLADWRISVATFQQKKKTDGTNVDFAEYVIERTDGACQKVTLESPSTIGLPTAADEDVIIALLALAKARQFASDIVRFVPSQLLKIMGAATSQKNYERLKKALKRLRALTVTYELTWYSRKTQSVEPVLITGILAEANLVLRRGRRTADSIPDSYVQWTRNFHQSLQEGNLTDLDLDLYFGWDRPGSKHLHRHLNKVWHAGRKPRPYERDLKELACGHLGMTNNKDLKRNFQAIIAELESRRYLAPAGDGTRYRKVRPGVWRVRLEIHPDQLRSKSAGVGESLKRTSTAGQSEAELLIGEYHRLRFGRHDYQPKPHELKQAHSMLRNHGFAVLQKLIPAVVQKVQDSFRGKDCHFGAAVSFFELAIEEQSDRDRLLARQSADRENNTRRRTAADCELNEKQTRRAVRLRQWRSLSAKQQSELFQRAIERTDSEFSRSRLCRLHDLNNPPTEVLALMAGERGVNATAEPNRTQ